MCAILSPEILLTMMKLFLLPMLGWLSCFSLLLNNQNPNRTDYLPSKYNLEAADFSSSQLYIKISHGFDFNFEEEDLAKSIATQKMLFELHKLMRNSDVISVKKPDIQYTYSNNNVYILEFEAVDNINDLSQQVQELYFIDYVRKVPIR